MNPTTASVADDVLVARPETDAQRALYSKINWRIVPLLLIAYMIAYLDRVNIGYAQLQMKETLTFDAAVYGMGAGIFFLGYVLFEVPSNLLLEKIGARKTLLRIMVLWGAVATGMMFVTTPMQFYILRFLLGAFEAGFFPGVILYFTYWYPSARRGRVIATFMSATTIIGVLAGPMSGAILKYFNGLNGWHGWQWLFLLQGAPAAVLGIIVFLVLKDKPADAQWLSPAEKELLRRDLDEGREAVVGHGKGVLGRLFRDPKVYALALVYFLLLGATYVMVFWMPTLIQSWGVKDVLMVGIYAAIPSAVGVAGMLLLGRSSDKFRERRWHFALCTMMAAASLWVTTLLTGNLSGSLVALSVATIGIASATPIFFAFVSEYLSKPAAACGIALVSTLGNFGPSITPSISGWIIRETGNNMNSMYFVIALYLVAGLVLLATMRKNERQAEIG